MGMSNIIDSIAHITALSTTELMETLLDPKYNPAHLRELIRRSVEAIKLQQKTINTYQQALRDSKNKHDKLKSALKQLLQDNEEVEY